MPRRCAHPGCDRFTWMNMLAPAVVFDGCKDHLVSAVRHAAEQHDPQAAPPADTISEGHGMTSSTQQDIDPFAGGDSVPAVSFKNASVGTTYTGVVTEAPVLVQSRDYNTGEPAFWPGINGQQGNPKMAVVTKVRLENGEERSIWATKPSAMFAAIKKASEEAGKSIQVGGTLAVKFTGEEPNPDKKKAPKKLYAAKYTPPPADNAFGGDEPPF